MTRTYYWTKLAPAAAGVVVWAAANPAMAFFPPVLAPQGGDGGAALTGAPVVVPTSIPVPVSIPVPPPPPPPYVPPPTPTVVTPTQVPNVPQEIPVPQVWHCPYTPPVVVASAETPEPATLVSGLIGLATVGAAARRRKRAG